jgi:hypothetical protein
MKLIDDARHVESRFGLLEDSVSAVQDRWTVSAKYTIGSRIILNEPEGTPGDEALVEARFSPFGDSVSVGAR